MEGGLSVVRNRREHIHTVVDVMLWTPFCHRFEIYLYSNFFIKPCCKVGACLKKFPRRHAARKWQLMFWALNSPSKCGWNMGHYLLPVLIRSLALILCQNIFEIM